MPMNTKNDSRSKLVFYLQEDAKANKCDKPFFALLMDYLYYRSENVLVYRYLWHLRHTEYYSNRRSIWQKLLHTYHKRKLSRLGSRYHIFIPQDKTGYGLRVNHLSGGGGVYLNVKRIGNYCSFNAGVLIGETGKGIVPTIGDNVSFGTGSKAYGDITISDNVFVAPNSVVTHDVPANCIVAGVPAKVLKYND